jgi:hypothetical protein
VNEETIEIYNIMTLRVDLPDHLRTPVVLRIQKWVEGTPMGKISSLPPDEYAALKKKNNLI